MSITTVRPEVPIRVITPDDVRASIGRAKFNLLKAADEIVWQIEMEAWRTLGYPSWSAMREAEYGGAAFLVPSKERPEIVARIRRAGQTQRETAETVGVTKRTVERYENPHQLRSTNVDTADNDVIDAEVIEDSDPPVVARRKRPPLTDSFWKVSYDLQKVTERLERLHQDDRFERNKNQVAAQNLGHLVQAEERIATLLNDLEAIK